MLIAASLAASLLALPISALPSGPGAPPSAATAGPTLGLFAGQPGATTLVVDTGFRDRLASIRGVALVPITLADGATIWAELRPMEVIRPGAEVRVGSRSRPELAAALAGVVQVHGTVVGEPGSLVHLAASERGAAGFIDRGPGRGRYALRPATGAARGLVAGLVRFDPSGGVSQPDVPLCATLDQGSQDGGVAGAGDVPPGIKPVIDIAVDSDYDYFAIFGDAQAATEYVAALYGAISAIYRRDTDCLVRVGFVRLFDNADDLFNEPDPLGPFRDYWNENMQAVDRDIAQLLSGRRNLPYGGVAWLNAACGDFGYSVNGYLIGAFADPVLPNPGNWDIIVVAHELGHNVGSQHTHTYGLDNCAGGDVQRGSIMSYCHINSGATANVDMRFHRVCADAMETFVMSVPCLSSDCDEDGVDDAMAIKAGTAADENADGIPDACQDCDGDGVLDPEAIAKGLVLDVDADGRPDGCEADCDGSGVPDDFEIRQGTLLDEYGDGVPDGCEPDCDGSGTADYSDIQANMAIDRSRDARIDACEDCDGDGLPDLEELDGGLSIWVSSADDSFVRELHPRSGVQLRAIDVSGGVGGDSIWDMAFGPDRRLYASVGTGVVRIDPADGSVTPIIALPALQFARGLGFAADGTLLLAQAPKGIGRYTTDGAFLGWFVAPNTANAPSNPVDLTVAGDGRVLVSTQGDRIWRFEADGSGATVLVNGNAGAAGFAGLLVPPGEVDLLAVSTVERRINRYDYATGAFQGRFDVQPGSLLNAPWGITLSADGIAALATSATSSSTINGYDLVLGYTERTYRVYPADAPAARAIAVAPASPTDANRNLIPDECESPLGDLDGDGDVDGADLAILLSGWGTPQGDLNGDGNTDAADLTVLLSAWG